MKTILLVIAITLTFTSCTKNEFESNFHMVNIEVFNGDSSEEWTEIDISEAVGENYAMVTLNIYSSKNIFIYFRQKGDTFDYAFPSSTLSMLSIGDRGKGQVIVYTDEKGVFEWKSSKITKVQVEVFSYVK